MFCDWVLRVVTERSCVVDDANRTVQKIERLITDIPSRDKAANKTQSFRIIKSLAEENGIHNFDDIQTKTIAAVLCENLAGPRTAHYVWRIYRSYRTTADWGEERISY